MARVSRKKEICSFEVIYKLCDEFGFKKSDIARIIGLSRQHIQHCERDGIILLRHVVALKSAISNKFAKDYADKLARLERAFTLNE